MSCGDRRNRPFGSGEPPLARGGELIENKHGERDNFSMINADCVVEVVSIVSDVYCDVSAERKYFREKSSAAFHTRVSLTPTAQREFLSKNKTLLRSLCATAINHCLFPSDLTFLYTINVHVDDDIINYAPMIRYSVVAGDAALSRAFAACVRACKLFPKNNAHFYAGSGRRPVYLDAARPEGSCR